MGKEIWAVQRKAFIDIFARDAEDGDPEELRSSKDSERRNNRIHWMFGCGDQCLDFPVAEFT